MLFADHESICGQQRDANSEKKKEFLPRKSKAISIRTIRPQNVTKSK
jgi:hypothetical protein